MHERKFWSARVVASTCAILASAPGCKGDDISDNDGIGPHFALEIASPGEMAIGDLPFPSDLHKDDQGELRIDAEALPFHASADQEVIARLAAGFQELDCFGPAGGVVFPIAGLEDSPGQDAGFEDDEALLVEAESGIVVPSQVYYRKREHLLHLRPRMGHALEQGKTYVAILAGPFELAGRSVAASPTLPTLLSTAPPQAAELATAHSKFAPVRVILADRGIAAEEVLAATVFSTCDYESTMLALADFVDAQDAPTITIERVVDDPDELEELLGTAGPGPGFGPEGVASTNLWAVVFGHISAPYFLAENKGALGRIEFEDGVPIVKADDQLPFILTIPKTPDSSVPVVVFQHGMGANGSRVLGMANRLAQEGFATIGIDAIFHGHRYAKVRDLVHNYTSLEGPDGIADESGTGPMMTYFDVFGEDEVSHFDPLVIADNFRQSATDLMIVSRAMVDGDWGALGGANLPLPSGDHLLLAAESFGGMVGTMTLAFDARFDAGFLVVTGGSFGEDLVENSPAYASLFLPLLAGTFGLGPNQLDPLYDPPHTHYAAQMFAMSVAGGDPATYAGRLRSRDQHLVLATAHQDEAMPNQSSQSLAMLLGLEWARVSGSPESLEYSGKDMAVVEVPVQGNQVRAGKPVTAAFAEIGPASHIMLLVRSGESTYEPTFPPFVPRDEPVPIDNPVAQLQEMLAAFAASLQTGVPVFVDGVVP